MMMRGLSDHDHEIGLLATRYLPHKSRKNFSQGGFSLNFFGKAKKILFQLKIMPTVAMIVIISIKADFGVMIVSEMMVGASVNQEVGKGK